MTDKRIVWIPLPDGAGGNYYLPTRLDRIKQLKWQPSYVDEPPAGAIRKNDTPEYLAMVMAA